MLQQHLQPVKKVGADVKKHIKQLVQNLDSKLFAVRVKARAELVKIGQPAVPELQRKLAGKPALETQLSIRAILTKIGPRVKRLSKDDLRARRAIELLEGLSSPEARGILKLLADGNPQATLTQEARAALDRLNK